MKLKLPAVNEPLIRVLVLTGKELARMTFHGERPQEVELSLPGVDLEKCKIGYVGVSAGGEEVGEPALLYEPPEPKAKVDRAGRVDPVTELSTTSRPIAVTGPATVTEVPPAAEAPPETLKVEEKPAATVKTGRK